MAFEKGIISIQNLKKEFIVSQKEKEGLLSSVKQLINQRQTVVTAVDNLSMNVNQGEIRALIGPNGSGKSTAIKIMTGVLYPTSGTVKVAGYIPWSDRKKYVRTIGVAAGQKSHLIWDLPAMDTYAFNREVYKIPKEKYKKNLAQFVELLDLKEIIRRPVRQLSLGERMKCELLCALLHEPQIVFLDEPTIGVDINAKAAIHKFIKQINTEKQTTFILTTHDLADVENLCENITVINKGNIVYMDSVKNIRSLVCNKRIVNLAFTEAVTKEALQEYEIIEWQPSRIKIKVDLTQKSINDIIAGIMQVATCTDIMIESIGIEEIIGQIYAGKINNQV